MRFDKLFSLAHTSGTQACPTVLLDGGLGTTLEDDFHKDITHPLWSARLVDEDEESIIAAHLAFLRAGSQIILTSTYQAAYETFRRAGYSDSDAEKLMRKSVDLAAEACKRYELETMSCPPSQPSSGSGPKLALSLGPYGATLETAAEYTGIYPPPYGPSQSSPTPRVHALVSEERSYEDALAAFHYSRLLVYARQAEIWDAIDIVAFETIPLVTEAKAIRRAVAQLQSWFQETNDREQRTREMRPWYISFIFPDPHEEFPQYRYEDNTSGEPQSLVEVHRTSKGWRPYTPREVAQAVFFFQDDSCNMATPNGIGVNCTKVPSISRIVDEFASIIKEMLLEHPNCFEELPWLVLLPNRGWTYDPMEHTWIGVDASSQVNAAPSPEEWARVFEETLPAQNTDHRPRWAGIFGGVLLGGCCKTGPREIQALKEALSNEHR